MRHALTALFAKVLFVLVAFWLTVPVATSAAMAEQPLANPLRPKAQETPARTRAAQTRAAKDNSAEKAAETPAAPARPPRERSAKQKQNDEMMRACGSEWRAEKAALQAKGETWRSFLKDCRAKKKTEQPI